MGPMIEAHEKRHTALAEMDPLMREKLKEGGCVTFSPKGTSMLPMLRSRGDSVTLEKPPARLKKGMVALFIARDPHGGTKYVLHRLVKLRGGRCIFMGDNRSSADEPVAPEDVIGVVRGFTRREKRYSGDETAYKLYSRYMVATRGFRRIALKLLKLMIKAWKKLKG